MPIRFTALAFIIMGFSTFSRSTEAASELQLKTEKVIVFKDGYCLVIKRGSAVTDADAQIQLKDLPDAVVLGSFWATPKEGRLVSMTAGWSDVESHAEKEVACSGTIEVLSANLGRPCKIELADKSVLNGVIKVVLARKTTTLVTPGLRSELNLPSLDSTTPVSAIAPTTPETRTISGLSGSQFILATDDGDLLLSASEVRKLHISDMKSTLKRTITTKERVKQLTFQFEEPNTERELLVMYFRPGVRWIPTYRVDLAKEGEKEIAKIDLQAELINEAEDLIDAPIDIVVGVPNFRFRTIPSPLSLERVMHNALQQAAPQLMGQFRNSASNLLYVQRSGEFRNRAASGSTESVAVDLPEELTAGGGQDLFVYNLPKLTLRRGQRTAVPIFSTTAPYRNVYTWDVHVKRNDISIAPSGSGVESPLVLAENKVWRQIVLTNTTNVPWTTGAAMVVEGSQPLAQELLTYTSPTDSCRIPVTVSVDMRGSLTESEVGRDLNAMKWNRSSYAKISQKAKLSLCNHKSITVTAEIVFRFGGKADEVSHDGEITLAPYRREDWQNYRGDPVVNNSSAVRWKVTLKPGEVVEPTVAYHYFTRH